MKLTDKWLWNLIQDPAGGRFEDAETAVQNRWTRAADEVNRRLLEGQPTAGIYRCSRCGFEGHTWQGLLKVSSDTPICTECRDRLAHLPENCGDNPTTAPARTADPTAAATSPENSVDVFRIPKSDRVKMERENARRHADGRDLVLSNMAGAGPEAVVLQPVTNRAEAWHESEVVPRT